MEKKRHELRVKQLFCVFLRVGCGAERGGYEGPNVERVLEGDHPGGDTGSVFGDGVVVLFSLAWASQSGALVFQLLSLLYPSTPLCRPASRRVQLPNDAPEHPGR